MAADPSGLRPVGVADAAKLAAVHACAFEAPWDAPAIAGLLQTPGAFALAVGSPVVGFVLARAVAGEAEILTLAVAPSHRRRGLGAALTQAACGLAGAEVVWLEVAEDNAAAQAVYAACGFVQAARRPRYYTRPGGHVDALMLKRSLNSGPG